MTTKNLIDDDLLEEKLAEYKREILNDVNQLIINVLNQKRPQPPERSPDVLLHKRLNEIAQENAPDAHKLVVSAFANHFKEFGDGRIYQYLQYVYGALN